MANTSDGLSPVDMKTAFDAIKRTGLNQEEIIALSREVGKGTAYATANAHARYGKVAAATFTAWQAFITAAGAAKPYCGMND